MLAELSCSRPQEESASVLIDTNTPSLPRSMEFPSVSLALEPRVLELITLPHFTEENIATLQVWDLIILRPQASDAP